MEQVLEILKIVIPAIFSGGLAWVLSYKLKKRELENKVYIEEYKGVDHIIEEFTHRNAKLAVEISNLTNDRIRRETLIGEIKILVQHGCHCEDKERLETLLQQV